MTTRRRQAGQRPATTSERPSTGLGLSLSFLRLPLPFSERRLLLTLLDLLAVVGALALLARFWPAGSSSMPLLRYPGWFAGLVALWLPLAHAFDAYDLRVSSRFVTAAPAVVRAGALASAIFYLLRPPFVDTGFHEAPTVLIGVGATLTLLLVGRGLYVLLLFQPRFYRRAIIVGAGWAGRTIACTVAENGGGIYELLGFIDDDPEKQGSVVLEVEGTSRTEEGLADESLGRDGRGMRSANGIPAQLRVVGDRHALKDLVTESGATTVILAITHEVGGDLLQTLMDCLELGVEIVPMPLLYEQLTGKVPVEHVGDNWYVSMPVNHSGTGTLWPLTKRVVDIALASIGLVLLAAATPFIAAAIYLDTRGPIFYTQERVGRGGRRFRAFKFRSMVPDAEAGVAIWASRNDKRVTGVGRLLRKTHVDEFPQFINILKGEMSAVGPRPERPEFVEELAEEIPFFRVRHAVRPGMAGWALVNHGYGGTREDTLIKLQYDLYYVKHQSLWLDTVILLKTIVDSLALRGR